MGANQDSVEVAFNLSIRNAHDFDYSAQDTMAAMAKDSSTRMNFFGRLHEHCMKGIVSTQEECLLVMQLWQMKPLTRKKANKFLITNADFRAKSI